MTDARAALDASLPLVIGRSEVEDPVLLVGGDEWSMSVLCDWRWRRSDGTEVRDGGPGASDAIWDLTGHTVMSVTWTAHTDFGLDPTLHLRDGGQLDVVSDGPFDTWQINLTDLVLVGPLVDEPR